LRNHDRVHNGNENLCNPPGRGLGPIGTTVTGYQYADAWMWTHPPGNSSGCGGGGRGLRRRGRGRRRCGGRGRRRGGTATAGR